MLSLKPCRVFGITTVETQGTSTSHVYLHHDGPSINILGGKGARCSSVKGFCVECDPIISTDLGKLGQGSGTRNIYKLCAGFLVVLFIVPSTK